MMVLCRILESSDLDLLTFMNFKFAVLYAERASEISVRSAEERIDGI